MEFRVLGSLGVSSLGREWRVPSAPKQQQTLALLLLQSNRFVSASSLSRELWGDAPPKTSGATLQAYIAQVRRFLAKVSGMPVGRIMKDVLVTESGGYSLRVGTPELDLASFEERVREGRAALGEGHAETALVLLRQALELFEGLVLENIPHGSVVEIQVRRIEQLRLSVIEQCHELNLRMGRHHEVIGALSEIVEENPFHENFHVLLMRALHQSGQRVEALRVYHLLQSRLDEELGLAPSPQVMALRQSILEPSAR
ncbi:AfsR/SARP family transcriptional regulator [Streptomyces sp. NPDC048385]|uniref:AfsR/SARP family transcriptional regulator n=1 Tax=unclassified Streptomyces TaxID=2593676 RepID=UPI00343F8113